MPKTTKPKSAAKAARDNPLAATSGNATRKVQSAADGKAPARTSLATKPFTTPNPDAKYLLLVRMSYIEDPAVERLLSIPPHFNFLQFHRILQIAFGWASCHAHSFNVQIADDDTPFERDLLVIQPQPMLMIEGLEEKASADVTLEDIYEDPRFEGKAKVVYNYDHGDGWEHEITLIGRPTPTSHKQMYLPDTIQVACLAGQGHPVAEDVGGVSGWEHLKELFAKPKKKDEDKRKAWYKTFCANGDQKGLDPSKWSIQDVNDEW
jgi:hypothetical protein